VEIALGIFLAIDVVIFELDVRVWRQIQHSVQLCVQQLVNKPF
jgi:hypothetical protein